MTAGPILFCVGAAKAGTSWLHRVLSDHPGCALRSIKELHFFDALDRGEVDRQVAAFGARRDGYLAEMEGAGPVRLATRARQVRDCEEWIAV
ncbi:MAG: sulfotransferase, partial [Rhodobacteraceae bacterium]|nr:sulfotransferase [Paracoccaceae bacterium]